MAQNNTFKEYLKRQLTFRGKVYEMLNMSRATYFRRMKDLNELSIGDFRKLIIIGELDEERVVDWLYGRTK